MTIIHIREEQPENGWWQVSFELRDDEFTGEDLLYVKAEVGAGSFNGGRHSLITLTYRRDYDHPRLAFKAIRILRERYPDVRFTTYSNVTKETFGNAVEQIPYESSTES